MLGYTELDVIRMIHSIDMAKKQLSPYLLTNQATSDNLNKAKDLLEGLIAEGHI